MKKLSKEQFEALKKEQKDIFKELYSLQEKQPESQEVQLVISKHFENIMKFWGTHKPYTNQSKKYNGLGQLYVADERYTKVNGVPQPKFADFLAKAIRYFARTQLN